MKKSTFIKLGVMSALLILPRRSSKKVSCFPDIQDVSRSKAIKHTQRQADD